MVADLGESQNAPARLLEAIWVLVQARSTQVEPELQSQSPYYASRMTKTELILRIAKLNPHLFHRDTEHAVATIFNEIADALAHGNRVELRGFGAFSVKHR